MVSIAPLEIEASNSLLTTETDNVRSSGAREPASQPHQPAQPLSLDDVVDDFSLQSQGIRFNVGREMKIYEQPHGQLILEAPNGDDDQLPQDQNNDGQNKILVKSTNDRGYSFVLLRATYSLMATFVGGFFFISGFDILLFLFIDLISTLRATVEGGEALLHFFAVLLSVPVFIYSISIGMTLVGRFVVDTFYGHPFLQSFGMGVVTTDWLAGIMYLGIPISTLIMTLFLRMGNWWEITLISWFSSIMTFWAFFSASALWLEVWACLELIEEDDGSTLMDDDPWKAKILYWLKKAMKGCVRTMQYRLSGTRIYFMKKHERNKISTLSNSKCTNFINRITCKMNYSEDVAPDGRGRIRSFAKESRYSYFFANGEWNPCFTTQPLERIHTLDEILGNTYYVTRHSWSLEKLFCRSGGMDSAIPITQGESSMTKAQINSTIACSLLGNISIVLLFVGAVVWFKPPPIMLVILILSLLAVVFFISVGFTLRRLWILRRDIVNDENPTLYRYKEEYRHSKPKVPLVWTVVFLEFVLFYLLPFIYLAKNFLFASLFAGFCYLSALNHYLNARILLLEKGDYFRNTERERKQWMKKSRLYHLVAVGGDSARKFWTTIYISLVLCFTGLAFWAAINDGNQQPGQDSSGKNTKMTLVDGYTYQPQPNLPYPTCQLKKGLSGDDVDLADFAFLSGLAYSPGSYVEEMLDTWYGEEKEASNNVTLVEEFKKHPDYEEHYNTGSAVSYRLITFSDNSAVLTIRGTSNVWDWVADAQLWLSATLFQGLRFVLPFSQLYTPILHRLVWLISLLESENLEKVSYYKETRGFVEYLKKQKLFEHLQVTGHSLGGGLAIITGVQSNTSAVALSGPNAMLSRDSFKPSLAVDDLNTLTFNVIPAMDPVPMVDDKATLYQNIKCTAEASDFISCHDLTRSLCELQYTCGSGNRPVPCECVLKYGYPEPSQKTRGTTQQTAFIQTCADTCSKAGGSTEKCGRWKTEANKLGAQEGGSASNSKNGDMFNEVV